MKKKTKKKKPYHFLQKPSFQCQELHRGWVQQQYLILLALSLQAYDLLEPLTATLLNYPLTWNPRGILVQNLPQRLCKSRNCFVKYFHESKLLIQIRYIEFNGKWVRDWILPRQFSPLGKIQISVFIFSYEILSSYVLMAPWQPHRHRVQKESSEFTPTVFTFNFILKSK